MLYFTARYNTFSDIHLDITVKTCVCTACVKIIVLFSMYYYKYKLLYIVTLLRNWLKSYICGCSHNEKPDTFVLFAIWIGEFKRCPTWSDHTLQEGMYYNYHFLNEYVISTICYIIFHNYQCMLSIIYQNNTFWKKHLESFVCNGIRPVSNSPIHLFYSIWSAFSNVSKHLATEVGKIILPFNADSSERY